jgi:hypothetical protein
MKRFSSLGTPRGATETPLLESESESTLSAAVVTLYFSLVKTVAMVILVSQRSKSQELGKTSNKMEGVFVVCKRRGYQDSGNQFTLIPETALLDPGNTHPRPAQTGLASGVGG